MQTVSYLLKYSSKCNAVSVIALLSTSCYAEYIILYIFFQGLHTQPESR